METIKLTPHQLNRLENLRIQKQQIEQAMHVFVVDIIDAKGLKLNPKGTIHYDAGVLQADIIPFTAQVKEKMKLSKTKKP